MGVYLPRLLPTYAVPVSSPNRVASAILIVKTSSLGDVVHNMPAVADLRSRFPDARIDWVVEEAYQPLVALHPAVNEAIPLAIRRWRRAALAPSTWREIRALRRRLRRVHYDCVLDTQGLVKSAIVAALTSGRRAGFDPASAREALAARFYDDRYSVPRDLHAVERCRRLAAQAFGYPLEAPVRYGLAIPARPELEGPYAVLLHATARREKHWDEGSWIEVARYLASRGVRSVLPFGSDAEYARSQRIAAVVEGSVVPPRRPVEAVAGMLAGAQVVVGVDTGLLHLAAALAVPLVAIFVATEPGLTGPVGAGPLVVCGSPGGPPQASDVIRAVEHVCGSG